MPRLTEKAIREIQKKAENVEFGEIRIIFRGDIPTIDVSVTSTKRILNTPKPGAVVKHYRNG